MVPSDGFACSANTIHCAKSEERMPLRVGGPGKSGDIQMLVAARRPQDAHAGATLRVDAFLVGEPREARAGAVDLGGQVGLRARAVGGRHDLVVGERVIREALLTSDDLKQAAGLRSFADESWTISYAAGSLRIVFTQNYPSPANPLTVTIPVARDDLDLSQAQLPAHVHIAAWKR